MYVVMLSCYAVTRAKSIGLIYINKSVYVQGTTVVAYFQSRCHFTKARTGTHSADPVNTIMADRHLDL